MCVHVCERENTAARYSDTQDEGSDGWFTPQPLNPISRLCPLPVLPRPP